MNTFSGRLLYVWLNIWYVLIQTWWMGISWYETYNSPCTCVILSSYNPL